MLDKEKLETLLRKADDKWFAKPGPYKYGAQVAFTADYIAKHYKNGGQNGNSKRNTSEKHQQ